MEKGDHESWLEKPANTWFSKIKLIDILAVIIIVLTLFSRLYMLGERVMSHDEVNHVVPSYDLYSGLGFRHDPVTHGPLQMHLIALTYFLLGDSDFTSRLSAAILSTAAVVFVLFGFRRYLGNVGAVVGGVMFMISPYMMFYGRYARNESYIMLFGVLMLYAVLRYLEKGDKLSLFLLSLSIVLHFTSKETAFIYTAQLLIFLVLLFVVEFFRRKQKGTLETIIWIVLLAALLGGSLVLGYYWEKHTALGAAQTSWWMLPTRIGGLAPMQLLVGVGFFGAIGALIVLVLHLKAVLPKEEFRTRRLFDMLVLVGSLVLPLLTAFPIKMIGWDPLDYTTVGMIHTGIFLVVMFASSFVLGIIWDMNLWLQNALLFWGIFIVFYTTFFTNGQGFFTGTVGGLGYWLSQQTVNRGGQPWYYFGALQLPMYEFLAILGVFVALFFGIKYRKFLTVAGISPAKQLDGEDLDAKVSKQRVKNDTTELIKVPVLLLLVFWSITSLVAYSIAGEKMPWITVHIAIPMILASGWGFGFLIERIKWEELKGVKTIIGLVLIPVFLASLAGVIGSVFGSLPPFQGKTLEQLQSTAGFLFSFIGFVASGIGIFRIFSEKSSNTVLKLMTLVVTIFLAVQTVRTSIRANFVNYDTGLEYLVYAHAARGPKDILAQVEEISQRTTKGLDIQVAYDNKGLYPYWWYFRHYPNKVYFADTPTRDLKNYPLVIAGEETWTKVDQLLKDEYYVFEYQRMVWPNMDYMNLTWERVKDMVLDGKMRQALFEIWFNRDYSLYANVTNESGLTLADWSPAEKLKFYIRKDIASQIWEYGILSETASVAPVDPYASKMIELQPDKVIGMPGNQSGQLNAPRGIAIAPDGTIYVADSRNHRIQHFTADGALINMWGQYANVLEGEAPAGYFNEPWGVAVSPDGYVYVADTWNYRIQKFTSDGTFVIMWSTYGTPESQIGFYGPRGIAVDAQGRVYVTDTGNKRVVVFDADGSYLSEFGGVGMDVGQFDEPVGIAVDLNKRIFVADTWNQRVQIFSPDATEQYYSFTETWQVSGWSSQSIDNKPFLAIDAHDNVFVTDPEGFRILEFSGSGTFLRGWGYYSPDPEGFGLPSGVALDSNNNVWVSDAGNNILLYFSISDLPIPIDVSQLPIFPPSIDKLVFDAASMTLKLENGTEEYQLDRENSTWKPIVPEAIRLSIPSYSIVTKDETNAWVIADLNGNWLYRWDYSTLQWMPIIH